jgi:hypothetical protein
VARRARPLSRRRASPRPTDAPTGPRLRQREIGRIAFAERHPSRCAAAGQRNHGHLAAAKKGKQAPATGFARFVIGLSRQLRARKRRTARGLRGAALRREETLLRCIGHQRARLRDVAVCKRCEPASGDRGDPFSFGAVCGSARNQRDRRYGECNPEVASAGVPPHPPELVGHGLHGAHRNATGIRRAITARLRETPRIGGARLST